MVHKKKLLNILSFMLLVIGCGFLLGNTCEASTYDITSGDLQIIYNFAKQQSIDFYPSGDTTNYGHLLRKWASGDEIMAVADLNYCAGLINDAMLTKWGNNGGLNGDWDIECFFIPDGQNALTSTSAQVLTFVFVNKNLNIFRVQEAYNSESWGTYYSHILQVANASGDSINQYNDTGNVIQLEIQLGSSPGIRYGKVSNNLYRWNYFAAYYKSVYSWLIDSTTYKTYGYGLLGLYRNSYNYGKDISYKPAGGSFNIYELYYKMNLDTANIWGGDTEPTPTPTPEPTQENPLDTTNGLIGDVISSLNETPSGDDFEIISSGDLINQLGLQPMHDPSTNFWYAITTGLRACLTNDVRYYYFTFLGIDVTIDNQDFNITNESLFSFVQKITILGYIFVEYKVLRKIVNMFASGIFKQLYHAFSRIDISDIF